MLPRIIEGAKSSSGKQIAFHMTAQTIKSSTDPRRQNAYLVALTALVKSIPKTAYLHQMPLVRLASPH